MKRIFVFMIAAFMIAPAAASLSTTAALAEGMLFNSALEWAVVRMLAVSIMSLWTIGMPCRGPRTRPLRRSSSRPLAMMIASGFPISFGLSTILKFTSGSPFSASKSVKFEMRGKSMQTMSTESVRVSLLPDLLISSLNETESSSGKPKLLICF